MRLSTSWPVWIVLFVMGLLVGETAEARDRGVKYDREVDFSTFGTYDWVPESKPQLEGSPLALGGAADTHIRDAIDRHLKKQGYEPALEGEPDFLVTYDGALEPVTDIEGQRRELATGVAWVVEGSINSYSRGTLVITFQNPETGKPVWSAWTTETVKDPDRPEKQIDRTVKKLLRRFPPSR